MGEWQMVKIGDLFSLEKGTLQSTKCTAGEYTFITASSDLKTHEQYSHECEALIYAVAASGSLGRCHYFIGMTRYCDIQTFWLDYFTQKSLYVKVILIVDFIKPL